MKFKQLQLKCDAFQKDEKVQEQGFYEIRAFLHESIHVVFKEYFLQYYFETYGWKKVTASFLEFRSLDETLIRLSPLSVCQSHSSSSETVVRDLKFCICIADYL